METTKNFHDASATIFFLLATAYLFAAFAFRNDFYPGYMIFFMRIFDIPLAFIALSYGGSGLYLQINEGREKTESVWGILVMAACIILFGFAVFVNFAFPSQI